jgi:hypothetical protein
MEIPFDTTPQPEMTPDFLEVIKNNTIGNYKTIT